MSNPGIDFGLFTVFGITERTQDWVDGFVSNVIGQKPDVLTYPDKKSLFYFSNFGDIAETESSFLIKLGFTRSMDGKPLNATELLDQKIAQPDQVMSERITGNALLIYISKLEAKFSAYQTLFALPQLFYAQWEGGILASTNIQVIVRLLQKVKLNEEAIPMLFLFHFLPGPLTYYKNIHRLYQGELLTWGKGSYSVRLVKTLHFHQNDDLIHQVNSATVTRYFDSLTAIMRTYLQTITQNGGKFGNLLSGGVDSSTIQMLINRNIKEGEVPLSFSYLWESPSFQFEVDYASHASKLLKTQHYFYQIPTVEYPDLLSQSIEALGRPNVFLVNSAQFALAKNLALKQPEVHYFFTGQCSDSLHGIAHLLSKEFKYNRLISRLPGSYALMHFLIPLMIFQSPKSKIIETMRVFLNSNTYRSILAPKEYMTLINRFEINYNIDFQRRAFGDKVLLNCLDFRHELLKKYYNSVNLAEKIQDMTLIFEGYESAVHNYHLFASQYKEKINFFLDEDVIRLTRAFAPEVRFLNDGVLKPILKKNLSLYSLESIASSKKGSSGLSESEILNLLKNGVLRDLVKSIERPDFLNRGDFKQIVEKTNYANVNVLWDLLNYDIYRKQISSYLA
jgi:asparagine synthetase B (glutamine-hydrolysing)